jgi:thioredoxin 1
MFETKDGKALAKKIAKGKTLVLFYASWCPDCQFFLPIFSSIAAKFKGTAMKARIDEDKNPMWGDYKIKRVPTLVLFENGKEKSRAEERGGSIPDSELEKLL